MKIVLCTTSHNSLCRTPCKLFKMAGIIANPNSQTSISTLGGTNSLTAYNRTLIHGLRRLLRTTLACTLSRIKGWSGIIMVSVDMGRVLTTVHLTITMVLGHQQTIQDILKVRHNLFLLYSATYHCAPLCTSLQHLQLG